MKRGHKGRKKNLNRTPKGFYAKSKKRSLHVYGV